MTQDLQRREGLCAPQLSPVLAIPFIEPPFAFEKTLRPGIVLAVGDEHDSGGRTRGARALQHDATAQDLVIRVRREHHQS